VASSAPQSGRTWALGEQQWQRENSPRDTRGEDPALRRGLRRSRRRAPCLPVEPTPLPAAPSAVELLALLTRVRSVRVALGELDAQRLYDLRAFKSCWAELAYLHRLAAGGRHGGTVVTSMRQLVAGVAPLHPSWKLTGDRFADRDSHHSAVRRRLSTLTAAQLLRWRVGLDEDLEERRTELELLPVPEVREEELLVAAAKLRAWEARYGRSLNTPSPIQIPNVKRHARPLTAAERQRRGRDRARHTARARRAPHGSQTITAPPFGAPPTSENSQQEHLRTRPPLRSAYTSRTRETEIRSNGTARQPEPEKAALRNTGSGVAEQPGDWREQIVERVAARRALVELRERQATQRAFELASWTLDRHWPVGRLREAWVVARHGAGEAALHGGRAAGPVVRETPPPQMVRRPGRDDYLTLRRAVARYERNRAAKPDGFPAGGLAALLHLGVLARDAQDQSGPMYLAYAIGALDQLSRRMRALATADSAGRKARQAARATQRRSASATSGPLAFRRGGWPAWVVLDSDGLPQVRVNERFEDALVTREPGPPSSKIAREVLRDALLVRHGSLPPELDGRALMAARERGELAPAQHRGAADPLVSELAELTGMSPRALAAFTAVQLQAMLDRARAMRRREAQRRRGEPNEGPSGD